MTIDLGQMKQVKASNLWRHEEYGFTTRLAAEDNIGRLADAPAALPLFVTALGALGLLGWRRKWKNAALAAA